MYSIFLVDDEELELEMIRDFIRWEEMGIYVAGTALNGRDAMEKIEVIQPDIVLTDVQMPIMDGLELAKQVSEQFDWIQFVFLTGHDEFDYVKSALNVGAVGYLLKPLDLSEIVSVIDKVKRRCEEVRMKNRSVRVTKSNILREMIYEQQEDRLANLAESYRTLTRRREPGMYSMTLLHIHRESASQAGVSLDDGSARLQAFLENWLAAKKLEVDFVPTREGELALWLEGMFHVSRFTWDDLLAELEDTLGFTVTAAVNEEERELGRIQELYRETRLMLQEMFYLGAGRVIYAKDVKRQDGHSPVPPFEEEAFAEAVHELNSEQAEQLIREYNLRLAALRIAKQDVCDWAIGVIERLLVQIHEPMTEAHKRAELYQSMYQCETMADIEDKVIQAVAHAVETLKHRFMDKNARLVHQIRTAIDQHFHEPITINSLSDQVYLSPNYLRSIFKEKTGMTIHDYLTRIRLNKAKELLADDTLKVQDIAQRVGYESTSYFISLFLKNQGVTPNEYRKNL
ncbi:response regulator [Paenibacillus campinasensis]|uniref:Response regulator n=1 Tax=Paenibacillus campinasensis TaxID=66347 RepID=A0ABW9SVV4_9BACL|nr:response regulator [Paenibacillus campinasensis]MUG65108.1 response regulator [Paenibacillus campinasensis]